MKPEEALMILDSAVSRVPATRQDHVVLQQALQVIQDALKPKAE